jgi:hypothetical protein
VGGGRGGAGGYVLLHAVENLLRCGQFSAVV